METLLTAAFPYVIGAVMLAGLLSLMIPILPGLWIMWISALVYGLITGFDTAGIIIMVVITLLTVTGGFMDNLFMAGSSKRAGASWKSILAALLGALIGSFFWPPFGGLILAMVAIFLVELLRLNDWRQALQSTRSLAVGCGWGVVARFGFGVLVYGVWLLWVTVF